MMRFLRIYFASLVAILIGGVIYSRSGLPINEPQLLSEVGLAVIGTGLILMVDRIALSAILPKDKEEEVCELRDELRSNTQEVSHLREVIEELQEQLSEQNKVR